MSAQRQVKGLLIISLALELAASQLLGGAKKDDVILESLPNEGVAKLKIPVPEHPETHQRYSETTIPLPLVIQLPPPQVYSTPHSSTPQKLTLNDSPDIDPTEVLIHKQKDKTTGAEYIHIIRATQIELRKRLAESDKPPTDLVPVFKMKTNEQNADGSKGLTIYVW